MPQDVSITQLQRVPVIIFGAGGVGSALIRQIVESRRPVAMRNGCWFAVTAVADSRSVVVATAAAGLSDEALLALVAAKQAGRPLPDASRGRPSPAALIADVAGATNAPGIVVDVTAAESMETAVDAALAHRFAVVLANKKPLAGPWSTAQNYFNRPRLRHESTVGGGQPVIATLRYLLDTNDPIYAIEGQMSGTLGFICGRLDAAVPFSEAVTTAKASGYTEPDPREDLGGQDVMRKVLILARMAGWPLETADITVESLYPAEMAALSVDDFMAALPQLDAAMAQRAATAAAEGNVLRYVARVTAAGGTVGLQALPQGSPLAGLKYISFHTARYDDEKLLIGGKGAGVEMTAAGVLGDMIDLVREELRHA